MKCKHCGAEWKAASSTGILGSCPFCGKVISLDDYFVQGKAYYNARNYDEAISCLEKAAEQGHMNSQFELGSMYYSENYNMRDCSKAEYWHLKAAAQGHKESQFELGKLYAFSNWPGHDDSKSQYWYYQAAANGHAEAQYLVGLRYDNENSSEFDYSQAEYWYYQAAMQGHLEAQFSLGRLYGFKDWSGQNYSSAEYWLLRSIKEYPQKQSLFYYLRLSFLGSLYRKSQNYTESVKWLLKSTEFGGKVSQGAIHELQEMAIEGHIEAIIALDQIKNRGFSISRAWNDIFC